MATEEEYQALLKLKVTYGQGYLFAKPGDNITSLKEYINT